MEQYTYEENESRYICNEFPNGFNEEVTLNFSSPYGCSKGAADQYMLDYYKIFGIKTVFRHSSILVVVNSQHLIRDGLVGLFSGYFAG